MSRQPRYNAADSSPFFADAQGARPPADGTLVNALGDAAMLSSGRAGKAIDAVTVAASAADASAAGDASTLPITPSRTAPQATLARGRERYTIFCQPCHGDRGEGDGEVVRRGFPRPPSFASEASRAASDNRIRDAIVHGIGVMYPFGDRVSIDDATAIVAYVRELQSRAPRPSPTSAPAASAVHE